ncbi:NlpC/P60 family protein [Streptomyces sp. NPDC055078]
MAAHRQPRGTRRPSGTGLTHSARATVLTAAAATAAAALGAGAASADPHDASPGGARAAVDRLFEEAEKATEKFNAADERAGKLRAKVDRAQDSVARGQERVNRMRGALGSLAGAQYRSGGIDPSLQLLLSSDPDTYLERAEFLGRVSERQNSALHDLQRAQRRLGQERAEATRDLAELERSRTAVAQHKRTVERKLSQAQRLLNSLSAQERADYDGDSRASRSGRDSAPEPAAGSGDSAASPRAAAAVAAARGVVGRPYVWGANGPSGFDCSGLTQWSYAQAGVGLPRTSQAQRYAGRQVPLSEARPGDLVAYRDDASHIGMYVGNGQVVHAPYPGASVRYDPVGMMPVSSVTRV